MLLLLDHENVAPAKRNPAWLLLPWLTNLRSRGELSDASVLSVTTRIYGGWYSGVGVSPSRYDAATFYADTWPAILSLPSRQLVRSGIEFADYLLNADQPVILEGPKITNTFVVRSAPPRLGLTDRFKACSEQKCERKTLRKWLAKGNGCFLDQCPHSFGECFVRKEQKQVDMHLAIDFIEACLYANGIDHIALASDDTDFVPALLWALRRKRPNLLSLTILRSIGQKSIYCESDLKRQGFEVVSY